MSDSVHYFLPRDIEGSDQLLGLALDLRRSSRLAHEAEGIE
jgi:hypothetical protein